MENHIERWNTYSPSNFEPHVVDQLPERRRGRKANLFTNEVVQLLENNIGKWVCVAELPLNKEHDVRNRLNSSGRNFCSRRPGATCTVRKEGNVVRLFVKLDQVV